jgi:hypothetical protein
MGEWFLFSSNNSSIQMSSNVDLDPYLLLAKRLSFLGRNKVEFLQLINSLSVPARLLNTIAACVVVPASVLK